MYGMESVKRILFLSWIGSFVIVIGAFLFRGLS